MNINYSTAKTIIRIWRNENRIYKKNYQERTIIKRKRFKIIKAFVSPFPKNNYIIEKNNFSLPNKRKINFQVSYGNLLEIEAKNEEKSLEIKAKRSSSSISRNDSFFIHSKKPLIMGNNKIPEQTNINELIISANKILKLYTFQMERANSLDFILNKFKSIICCFNYLNINDNSDFLKNLNNEILGKILFLFFF